MKKNKLLPFHLAIPVHDLEKSRNFYKNVLGCEEGRSSDHEIKSVDEISSNDI
jgi:extradiol dioxygenase family protein